MVNLTRINGAPLVLNSDLIEQIESSPDTVVRLTSGQRLVVKESPAEVVDRVVEFRRRIHLPWPPCGPREPHGR